jgi:triphosphatase
MNQEIELKFIGPEDALARLRESPALKRLAAGQLAVTRQLTANYFDTGKFALRNASVVLRVRDEGQGFVQTVKSIEGPDVATRTELKAAVKKMAPDVDAIDDKAIRRTIKKATRREKLKPIFAVDMQRTTIVLKPKRGCEVEVAFDMGRVKTTEGDDHELPILEVEFELLKGEASELVACARELTSDLPLTLCLQSKAARGYALAGATVDAPVKAARLVLPAKASAGDAFARIVSHCLHHLLGNWASVVQARDPEGIHQMRVAIRRLRCAVGLFGGPFRSSIQSVESELRWLAGVLGAARDLDVFDDEVFRPVATAHGDDVRLEALASVVRVRRREAWVGVIAALESERFRRLMLDIAAATLCRPWLGNSAKAVSRPAGELARKRMARRHAQALKLGNKIERLDAKARHKLRIRLKKLRYALDFFASLFPKREVGEYSRRLGELQETLGKMNDAAVARQFVEALMGESLADAGAVNYACGVVAGWHLGHERDRHKALAHQWRHFSKLKPMWK